MLKKKLEKIMLYLKSKGLKIGRKRPKLTPREPPKQ